MLWAIVTGPRDGSGDRNVYRALDRACMHPQIPRFDGIVVGSNRGTDYEAYEWAMKRERPCLTWPARWRTGERTGPPEGPIRNGAMYGWASPVVVLGFPGGTGTAGMMSISVEGGTPAWWWGETFDMWALDERLE